MTSAAIRADFQNPIMASISISNKTGLDAFLFLLEYSSLKFTSGDLITLSTLFKEKKHFSIVSFYDCLFEINFFMNIY